MTECPVCGTPLDIPARCPGCGTYVIEQPYVDLTVIDGEDQPFAWDQPEESNADDESE